MMRRLSVFLVVVALVFASLPGVRALVIPAAVTQLADGVQLQLVRGEAGEPPAGAAQLTLDRLTLGSGIEAEIPAADAVSAWFVRAGTVEIDGESVAAGSGIVTGGDDAVTLANVGRGEASVLRFGVIGDGQVLTPTEVIPDGVESLVRVTFPVVPASPAELVLGVLTFVPGAVLPASESSGPVILLPASGPITLTEPADYAGVYQPGEAFAASSTVAKALANDGADPVTVIVAGILPQAGDPFLFPGAEPSVTATVKPKPKKTATPKAKKTPASATPLRDLLPGPGDVPDGLVVTYDQARSAADIASTSIDPASMPGRLQDWGWQENYTRKFAAPDVASSSSAGLTYLECSAHRFDSTQGTLAALAYFVDERAHAGGLTEVTAPAIGDKARAIAGRALVANMPEGSREISIYLVFGKDLLRVTAVSPVGDAAAQLLAILPGLVARFTGGAATSPATAVPDEEIVVGKGAPAVILEGFGSNQHFWTIAHGDGLIFASPSPNCCGIPGDPLLIAFDAKTGQERWRVEGKVSLPAGITYADGRVYVVNANQGGAVGQSIAAYDSDDGRLSWTFAFNDGGYAYDCAPVFQDGALYVASGPSVVELDAKTGQERWRWTNEGGMACHLALVENRLFAAIESNSSYQASGLVALDAGSGAELWSYAAPIVAEATVVARPEGVYLAAGSAGVLAFDPASGEQRWQAVPEGVEQYSPVLVATSSSVYAGVVGGSAVSLSARSGKERWRYATGDERVASIAIYDGRVVVASNSGHFGLDYSGSEPKAVDGSATLAALDTKDGAVGWTIALPSIVFADLLVVKQRIYVATARGVILFG